MYVNNNVFVFVLLAVQFLLLVVVVVRFSRFTSQHSTNAKAGMNVSIDCFITIFVLFFLLQRLIKMNMPIMGDNTVLFTSTLFALIRTALGIFSTGDPAYADSELRRTIKILWPKTSKKILEKMIPLQSGKNTLTLYTDVISSVDFDAEQIFRPHALRI